MEVLKSLHVQYWFCEWKNISLILDISQFLATNVNLYQT